jgi:hypothetical protein
MSAEGIGIRYRESEKEKETDRLARRALQDSIGNEQDWEVSRIGEHYSLPKE